MENYVDFAVQKAVELLAIDSPTGYTAEAEEFVLREFRALGFAAERTAKGGILIDLGGENADDALLLEAHADMLGGMVAEIKGDGRLRIVNVGGMNANNAEAENCRVVTKVLRQLRGARCSLSMPPSMSTAIMPPQSAAGTPWRSCWTRPSSPRTT